MYLAHYGSAIPIDAKSSTIRMQAKIADEYASVKALSAAANSRSKEQVFAKKSIKIAELNNEEDGVTSIIGLFEFIFFLFQIFRLFF